MVLKIPTQFVAPGNINELSNTNKGSILWYEISIVNDSIVISLPFYRIMFSHLFRFPI
jgi:hypothetical protein